MKKIFFFLLLLLWTTVASAGMIIESRTAQGERFLFACEGSLFRMGTEDNYTIMDAEGQMFYTVIPAEKTYYAISVEESRKNLEAMEKRLNKVEKTLGAIGKKFGSLFGGKDDQAQEEAPPVAPEVVYKKTGQKGKVAGWRAEKFIIYKNGEPVSEIWASKWLAVEMARVCNLRKLAEITKASVPENWSDDALPTIEADKYEELGYPLKERTSQGELVMEVIRAEKKKLSRDFFSIPENYKKASYPQMQGGRPW
ncbi:DUF4412 domain-containing protein [Thermosulfuriphilus sp.]